METPSGDSTVAQFEDALKALTLSTWNRVRSQEELSSFIDRRHTALTDIEL
ncbi:MAG: hypothetical protein UW38_C0001G0596 [Candidatus Saccharibacteria bacterium GW2011_GWC2_44_17]|nr:MAG: hypothetical protein UW38_C0001G0596 [Candidatus Saccharibacteria bacterium GW2011_GWC2_44_17]MBH1956863.1 hypothetical protein [Candidatus Saccharibacteria bacterium]MBH1973349.1 hypothetical protein [Candidatus Saccharibacteria bacterium]MBH1990410.1 hypothetical protein [Candidatus Saccharibacteria bacterium]